eukprot:1148840-Pelagomonas_calceolata.AAC.4
MGLVGSWQHVAPGNQGYGIYLGIWPCIFTLPDWTCAALHLFDNSHTAKYPMLRGSGVSIGVSRARSDQDSARAAGVASSLIRNTEIKKVWRYYTIRGLLSDVQVMLGLMVCAAYVHVHKGSLSHFLIPGMMACLALRKGLLLPFLRNHLAFRISLAKSWSQIPGMLRKSNFLAGPGLGIIIGELTFLNDPKLVAKVRVSSEWFRVGTVTISLSLAGRSMEVAPAIYCLRIPPRQPASDHIPEAPSSTHQGRGARPAPHRISKLPCLHLSIHGATYTIVRTEIKDPVATGIMQIYWLSGKLKQSAGELQSPQNGHPQTPDPARASTKKC